VLGIRTEHQYQFHDQAGWSGLCTPWVAAPGGHNHGALYFGGSHMENRM